MPLSHAAVKGFLKQQGFISSSKASAKEVRAALVEFQKQYNLLADGEAGDIVERYMDRPRFCSVKDRSSTTKCRWDSKERPLPLTWFITRYLSGVSKDVQDAIFNEAWLRWDRVCGIRSSMAASKAEANVVMYAGKEDGRNGTLAWSELPCGPDQQLEQLYDRDENWFFGMDIPTGGRTSLLAVACHEIGHVIGLDHLAEGNLLAPFYNPMVREPQQGDIAEAVLRYGEAVVPPPPTDPALRDVIVEFDGQRFTTKEVKVFSL